MTNFYHGMKKEPFLTRAPVSRYFKVEQERSADGIVVTLGSEGVCREAMVVPLSGSETHDFIFFNLF